MKKMFFLVAIAALAGCKNTRIEYLTQRMQTPSWEAKAEKTNLNIIAADTYANNFFKEVFAEVANGSGKFATINEKSNFIASNTPTLQVNVESKYHMNILNAVASLCTLGFIPNHGQTDITFTCMYSHEGENLEYEFKESVSVWKGWLVTNNDTDRIDGKNEKTIELFENISNNILHNLKKDGAL